MAGYIWPVDMRIYTYPQEMGDFLRRLDEKLLDWQLAGYKPYSVKKGHDATEYIVNIPAALDLECCNYKELIRSTPTKDYYMRTAWPVAWGVSICMTCIIGRSMEELRDFERLISEHMGLSIADHRYMRIYVHNMGFDFSFFHRWLNGWKKVFGKKRLQPLEAINGRGIQYRDSQILAMKKLEELPGDLLDYNIKKAVGDWDYDKIRTENTPLTPEELGYLRDDCHVLCAYIAERIAENGDDISKIPMTRTGYVRRYCKEHTINHPDVRKRTDYRKKIQLLELTVEDVKMLEAAFMGGFTHGNKYKAGKTQKDVGGFDKVSFYPSLMVGEKYPMETFKDCSNIQTMQDIRSYADTHAVLLKVRITGISSNWPYEHFISSDKMHDCNKNDFEFYNGRLIRAKNPNASFVIYCTEMDMLVYDFDYNWDKLEILECKISRKEYLPWLFVECVLHFYQGKTTLKGKKGHELEYAILKGMLNGIFGATVQKIARDIVGYDMDTDEWTGEEPADLETALYGPLVEKFDKKTGQMVKKRQATKGYNKSRGRYNWYPWGVWITAYARYYIARAIFAMGADHGYTDTDSEKCNNWQLHEQWFIDDGKEYYKKLETALRYHGVPQSEWLDLLAPEDVDHIRHPLGEWDHDATYEEFRFLRAKSYMYKDMKGNYHSTVAGCAPDAVAKYCQALNPADPLSEFQSGLEIPEDYTGKLTHYYCDEMWQGYVTDYLGNTDYVVTLGGTHLGGCTFKLREGSCNAYDVSDADVLTEWEEMEYTEELGI